jgi:hypothetical protein
MRPFGERADKTGQVRGEDGLVDQQAGVVLAGGDEQRYAGARPGVTCRLTTPIVPEARAYPIASATATSSCSESRKSTDG